MCMCMCMCDVIQLLLTMHLLCIFLSFFFYFLCYTISVSIFPFLESEVTLNELGVFELSLNISGEKVTNANAEVFFLERMKELRDFGMETPTNGANENVGFGTFSFGKSHKRTNTQQLYDCVFHFFGTNS